MSLNHTEVLQKIYDLAIKKNSDNNFEPELSEDTLSKVDLLVSRSEQNKGLLTVLITLLVHKVVDPRQDIRYHQAQLENGFAGRGIDQNHITPFMKKMKFPAMAESGWLTRSLEQPHPYDLSYPGNIRPEDVKKSFLTLINDVQINHVAPALILEYLFQKLIIQRDQLQIDLAKPHNLTIATIILLLQNHFSYSYSCAGASRLPTLAIYAAYQCLMNQLSRYHEKLLCELEPHNSADAKSGRIGDIDIVNLDGSAFEGVEVKHEIPITSQLIWDSYDKFKKYHTDRYYLLTTANMDSIDWEAIESVTQKIKQIHGCQVIVNGVYSTLRYYLRLIKDTSEFIDKYVELLKKDGTIKFQHKTAWNDCISQIN